MDNKKANSSKGSVIREFTGVLPPVLFPLVIGRLVRHKMKFTATDHRRGGGGVLLQAVGNVWCCGAGL